MSDTIPPTEPNPPADIERVASAAIARPVRVDRIEDGVAYLLAPHDTTIHGHRAIVAAVGDSHPDLVCVVALDAPPAEP